MISPKITLAALALASALPAQALRRAVAFSDVVVVATSVGTRPLTKGLVVHRLRIDESLFGAGGATHLSVIEHARGSGHHRPGIAERRIYCLVDFAAEATALGLPGRWAPYYAMSGLQGSNPAVAGTPQVDPALELARALSDARVGAPVAETTAALLAIVRDGHGPARIEAVRALAERPERRALLTEADGRDLLARAVRETRDIEYKVALSQACAELAVEGCVDALCGALGAVDDARFSRALGRVARSLHGENAAAMFAGQLDADPTDRVRDGLLTALGATSSDAALQILLQRHAKGGADKAAVTAALRLHGSRVALRAVAKDGEQ